VKDNCSPYDVLRLAPDATNEEIKAQYRKLVADNHPDRLMGRGVPAEFVAIATRKLAAINAAYDTIARERGL
jgi:DnaJ like chaperone protein